MTTILVVDDEADMVELLSCCLRPAGFHVVTATNGLEAIQQARRHAPEVILLDILLEGMDGYSVCQVFHEDPATADIPVILVTALSGEIARLNGMVAGAADFIRKPFAPDDVVRRVQRQLDRARAGSPRTRGPGPGLRP